MSCEESALSPMRQLAAGRPTHCGEASALHAGKRGDVDASKADAAAIGVR